MTLASPTRTNGARLIDREERLSAFIDAGLDTGNGDAPITLIARSTTSPVVRAVAAYARRSGRAVRAVFLDIDTTAEDHGEASILDLGLGEFRVLNDQRFGAAHEQLTLDNTRVWIGDSMRRDPAKRDAFEIYHDCHPAAHRDAVQSFNRVWKLAKPLAKRSKTIAPTEAVIAGEQRKTGRKPERFIG